MNNSETVAVLKDTKIETSSKTRQLSITDMFQRKAKRKADDDKENQIESSENLSEPTAAPSNKRIKENGVHIEVENGNTTPLINGDVESSSVKQAPEDKSCADQSTEDLSLLKKKTSTIKCKECRQLLDDVDIFPGDSPDACEEFIALTHESLSVFVGNEETGRPQHKITNFSVYDKNTHLCPFDGGLIEKNVELFFSGFIKPIYVEDTSVEGGVEATRLGPINAWWTAGFDGGEKALVGFSTAFAEYFLTEASSCYSKIWETMQEKIYMSKLVIEYLSDNEEVGYEDLVNYIRRCVPPPYIQIYGFTEDSLLRHAQFVVEQVESFDDARTDDEEPLIGRMCMRDLIHLAGVTLGKRKTARRQIVKEKKVVKASSTKATTTELVASVMESFFQGTVDTKISKARRRRCGVCENCQEPDCGTCSACKDMVKFGGTGTSKQACVKRKCPNMIYNEDEDASEEKEEVIPKSIFTSPHETKGMRKSKKTQSWIGEPSNKSNSKLYYKSVKINDEIVEIGDCVSVLPNDQEKGLYVGKIVKLWEGSSKVKWMHIDWFIRASESILGEGADKAELFLTDDCEDTKIEYVSCKVEVHQLAQPDDWFMLGGEPLKTHSYDGVTTFFYQKWYDFEIARFVDPPVTTCSEGECESCFRIEDKEQRNTPMANGEISKSKNAVKYEKLQYKGETFSVGDSVYLLPEACDFDALQAEEKAQTKSKKKFDCDEYPELYRKTKHIKGSNENVPEPFRVVRIISIFSRNKSNAEKKNAVELEVAKFYRPENTHQGISVSYYNDLNMLYWSDETVIVPAKEIQGKCRVEYEYDLRTALHEYTNGGPDRFYFNEAYSASDKSLDEPPLSSRKMRGKSNGKVSSKSGKITKVTTKQLAKEQEVEEEVQNSFSKLKTLDVFAGCGGLSEGFHQAGIAESSFAIELWDPAAQAYRLNNPGATVFTEDCNVILRQIMDGEQKNSCGQTLPKRGEIELLCGGPPCQGFSGMNRFNSREYSRFKNSLVVSYLSYCDYFRPRFFLLENVRNFVSFKNCLVLKLTMATLIKMGYQCTFGVLQAGHYGVAQTRRRAIILAAAPGEKLPFYPEPLHSFSLKSGSLIVQIDDKRYRNNITRLSSAPFRTITVRDTMSDLPKIANGHSKVEISYQSDPRSHFQRVIRGSNYQPVLRDHICKLMSPLVEARMSYIPLTAGSDWRDLPNKQVKLPDGYTKLLRYTHHDKRQGKSPSGSMRGVCSCATGGQCDPMDRQFNTLIPWCLPHTGNRHNHWAGLYGRLEWDGYFSTTVTNPEPMGKQGRVLHPEQHRVVSVRECARSQGFPDTYRFFGTTLDKHREVGNAVPPLMAKAIGHEIKKSLVWKTAQTVKTKKIED